MARHVYVLAQRTLLVWDSTEDDWQERPTPLRDDPWSSADLVVDGSRLVLASHSDEHGVRRDHVLDTTTGRWSTLPQDR